MDTIAALAAGAAECARRWPTAPLERNAVGNVVLVVDDARMSPIWTF
ncbi:hypothetical protein MAHJHV65_43560 [Mycobacterium avium subsp. hominissuis]